MPVLRFRVYWEEEESTYRDILIHSGQTFLQLHQAILQAYDFDQKHRATFFRSNDQWQRGREILLEADDQRRRVPPLMMADTLIGDAIRSPNEKFIYLYDFAKHWTFLVELIAVIRDEKNAGDYPACVRKEGPAPSQYGNKKPVKDQMVETDEQYDLNAGDNDAGYGEEGEDTPGENAEANGTDDLF